MKQLSNVWKAVTLFVATALLSVSLAEASGGTAHKRLLRDCKKAKTEFVKEDKLMQQLFDNSYAYVIFPNAGKGALGLGAAAGHGLVYEKGALVGKANMRQLTVGLQLGGQAFREVIFFENKAAFDRFRNDHFEFSAGMSAVAVTAGASSNINYRDGVMVFTGQKSGLMYDVSLGAQKFDYTTL